MPALGVLCLCAVPLLGAVALYSDARRRRIPDAVPLGLLLFWVAAVLLAPAALGAGVAAALGCGAGMFAAGYAFHRLGWLGGGDGKLLGALALWIGPWDAGIWLLAVAATGLVLCGIALARPAGDFRTRGIPFAWAIAPSAMALLLGRAMSLAGV